MSADEIARLGAILLARVVFFAFTLDCVESLDFEAPYSSEFAAPDLCVLGNPEASLGPLAPFGVPCLPIFVRLEPGYPLEASKMPSRLGNPGCVWAVVGAPLAPLLIYYGMCKYARAVFWRFFGPLLEFPSWLALFHRCFGNSVRFRGDGAWPGRD